MKFTVSLCLTNVGKLTTDLNRSLGTGSSEGAASMDVTRFCRMYSGFSPLFINFLISSTPGKSDSETLLPETEAVLEAFLSDLFPADNDLEKQTRDV